MSTPDPAPVAKPSTKKPSLPPATASSTPSDASARSPGNWRKTLFRLHGWMGLNMGLLLFVICFSGSIATLSNEIDWLLDPAHRTSAQEAPYDWTAMHETLRATFPYGTNLGVYAPGSAYAPPGDGGAAVAYVAVPNGQTRKVYLNPYTGALQGHTSFFNTQRFFRSFHRRFFDGVRGIVIVTLMGLPLLLSALTGVLFYKGWLKQLFTLRRGKGQRLLWSDLHKGAGIWGLLFTVLIALTGLFYLTELGFQAADNYDALLPDPLPEVEEVTLNDLGPQPELLPESAYVAVATQAFPDLEVRSIRMPQTPTDAVYIDGRAGNPLVRDRANSVHLHPFTGEVLGVQRSAAYGAVPFITDAADPLHFGYFGGIWTKVLWCLLGLLLSFSILSGTYLWVVRSEPVRSEPVRSSNGRSEKRAAGGWRSVPMLRGAVVATVLTLVYFGVVTFAVLDGIQGYAPQRAPAVEVAQVEAGPYRATVVCLSPCRPAEGATFRARFRGTGLPNLRRATLRAAGENNADGSGVEMKGPARTPSADVQVAPGAPLTLELETRGGPVYRARFTAPSPAPATAAQAAALPTWPDTAPGVWWVVAAFAVLTVGFIAGWLWWVVRAFRAKQAKLQVRAQAANSTAAGR